MQSVKGFLDGRLIDMRKFLAILLCCLPVGAGAEARLMADEARAKLLAARPDLPVTSVQESRLEGFFEVRIEGGMILYMNETADYFFAGDLFYIQQQGLINATEMARVEARRELLGSLDKSEMVIFAPKPELTQATITVFTDIDCGYCRKLHQEVPELNRLGIAVQYLAFPRAGIGSESYDKAVSAWCADNPQLALTMAKAGKEIEEKTCANPIARQYELGGQFGVTGTPAIVYEDGTLQAGYLPAAVMAERLGVN